MNEQSATGYASREYAEALAEFGTPLRLEQSGGWLLTRQIPGSDVQDAMGCYPLFACNDWTKLAADFDDLAGELVSLVAVTEPFGSYDERLLEGAFPDLVRPFKTHFVSNLKDRAESFVSKHHRYYARKALEKVRVERCSVSEGFANEWSALYEHLVSRHKLTGIKAFSKSSFEKQLRVPGMVIFRAMHDDETVGAHLWFVQGDVALSHLAATNERGYQLMAAYALYWKALEYFIGHVRYLDWGAGAGLHTIGQDGLTQFKRGWANDTRITFLCGRIFDHEKYRAIIAAQGAPHSQYFPAYRAGEF